MVGTWKGYYKYDNEKIQKSIGFEKTYFTIVIHSFNGKTFSGIVLDDLTTGGMEGEGKIIGTIENDKVTFKKLMKKTSLISTNGTKKYLEKTHPAIYYTGTITPDQLHMEGHWKFKTQIMFLFGIIPLPVKFCPGFWSMNLQK